MMQVHTDPSSLPAFRNAVVTIGTFDGVHEGHRAILRQLCERARETGGESVIITFHPHPRVVVGTHHKIDLLTTLPERIRLLEEAGVDHLVVIPFNESFAGMDATQYVSDFLVAHFHPKLVIIGYDHRFGKGRSGDYRLLEDLSTRFGFSVQEIPEQLLNAAAVSSTRIRQALKTGNLSEANASLGHPYFFEGTVVKGDQRGRTIGYPTANIQPGDPDKLIPAHGVYAVTVQIVGEEKDTPLQGMMNIGVRPTVDGSHRTIEVNLLDFEGDLYGKTLRVELREFLRPEKKFGSLDDLKMQLSEDRENTLRALAP